MGVRRRIYFIESLIEHGADATPSIKLLLTLHTTVISNVSSIEGVHKIWTNTSGLVTNDYRVYNLLYSVCIVSDLLFLCMRTLTVFIVNTEITVWSSRTESECSQQLVPTWWSTIIAKYCINVLQYSFLSENVVHTFKH